MALFQKKPIELRQNIPYSVSIATDTKLIVGLGNPGDSYKLTRHNIGFIALEQFAAANDFGPWQDDNKLKCLRAEKVMGKTKVVLVQPQTFMNNSGEAVQAVAHYYKIPLKSIIAVHDELSIPFGQIRTRIGGQAAGHNGIKSLIQHLGVDFGRVRIGIKNDFSDKADASEFVLGKFTKIEQSYLDDICGEVNGIITEYVYGGSLPHDTRSIVFDYDE